MAERIHDAKFVELPGRDHLPWVGNADAVLDEIEDFLTGMRRGPDPDRILATVMFTDIVESTRKAAELGDHRWRDVLTAFQARPAITSRDFVDARSTPRATASWPRSTDRPAPCEPPPR